MSGSRRRHRTSHRARLRSGQPEIPVKSRAKLALAYVRTSTPNKSVAAQQRALTARAREWGWPKSRIRILDEDLGQSGLSTRRAGFKKLRALVRGGLVGLIVAADLTRLSRDPTQLAAFLKEARRTRTGIVVNGRPLFLNRQKREGTQ